MDSQLGWLVRTNLEDSTPLSESGASFIVLLATLAEAIQTLGGCFPIGSGKLYSALVNLNTRKNSSFLQQLYERFSCHKLHNKNKA
jgi:hypothetical protein